MSGKTMFWTEARVQQALEVLRQFPQHEMDKAVETFNRETGSHVSKHALHFAVKRVTGMPPGAHMIPRWDVTMPMGQRLKGNSTLLDGKKQVDRRWVKTEREPKGPPNFKPVAGDQFVKRTSTNFGRQGEVLSQWVQAEKDRQHRWDEFWAACDRAAKRFKGIARKVAVPKLVDARGLTVYPLGDPHIGMLAHGRETGENFDLKIAQRELVQAVDMLVEGAPRSKRAILVNVGDFFHSQSNAQVTPRGGNKLDVDSRLSKVVDVGFAILERLVNRMLEKHEWVGVKNVPGNHDPDLAIMLNKWMAAVYRNEPRVHILPNENPYSYWRHGKTLLGFAHGDGAKMDKLPGIMAAETGQLWGATEFHMWITGHIHQTMRIEAPACIVESFRTLAPRDFWSHHRGYRSGQSLNAITFDRDFGEVLRSTVDIKLVRAALRRSKKAA